MKKIGFLAALLCAAFVLNAHASDVEVSFKSPKGVFTPRGFDDNDDVVVVLSGFFYNTCFKAAPPVVKVNQAAHQIAIEHKIYSLDQCKNGLMYIPYTQVVDIGILPAGNYSVVVNDDAGTMQQRSNFVVTVSKPSPYSPDSSLYAQVNEVQFFPAKVRGQNNRIVLRGTFSNSCVSLATVKVNYSEGKVAEILPLAKVSGGDCQLKRTAYLKEVELPGFPDGEVLLHIRSMGGQSLNRVITALDRVDIQP